MSSSPCPGAKESSGCVPSLVNRCLICAAFGMENCPPMLCGSLANRNLELLGDTCIGNSAWPLKPKSLLPELKKCLDVEYMPNFQGPKPPPTTAVRRTLELMDLGNGVQNPFVETAVPTGSTYGPPPSPEISIPSLQTFEWFLIGPFEVLGRTSWRLGIYLLTIGLLFEKYSYFGAERVLENREEPGTKPGWTLIVRIPGPNSGMDTRVRKVLLSMNFEEESMLPIYCGGVIGIRSVWKLKDPADHWRLKESGLRRMWTPVCGTRI